MNALIQQHAGQAQGAAKDLERYFITRLSHAGRLLHKRQFIPWYAKTILINAKGFQFCTKTPKLSLLWDGSRAVHPLDVFRHWEQQFCTQPGCNSRHFDALDMWCCVCLCMPIHGHMHSMQTQNGIDWSASLFVHTDMHMHMVSGHLLHTSWVMKVCRSSL